MMKFRGTFWALLFALAGASCGTNADPVAKATVDGWYNELVRKAGEVQPQKSRPAVAVGQYARYLELNGENHPAQVTYKVLEDSGAMVLEVVRFDYEGQTIHRLTVRPWEAGQLPTVIDVRVQRNGGPVESIAMDDATDLLNRLVGPMSHQALADEAQPQKVAAGSFVGCRKAEGTVRWREQARHSVTWLHGAVPITGWVKSESKDGAFKRELTEYGMQGAKTSIRDTAP